MTRITIVAILLALPGLAAAQQPDHIAVHGLASFYTEDADPHWAPRCPGTSTSGATGA